jgi:hypothetical protein
MTRRKPEKGAYAMFVRDGGKTEKFGLDDPSGEAAWITP